MSVRTGVDEYNQPTSDINSGYVGEFKYFGFSEVPPHCLACDGSEVSRETYSELFEVFGETFGAGNGSTTFNLPDFRGRFLRCVGGNSAELGIAQGDAIRNITGSFDIRGNSSTNSGQVLYPPSASGAISAAILDPQGANSVAFGAGPTNFVKALLDVSTVVPTAVENRPINYAVNICVVFE